MSSSIVERRRLALVTTLLAVIVVVLLRSAFGGALTSGGFEDPTDESARAADALAEVFDRAEPGIVLVATSATGSVDDPAAVDAGRALTDRLAQQPGVVDVVSYWTTGAEGLRSADGDRALVLARVDLDEAEANRRAAEIAEAFTTTTGVLDVGVTGEQVIGDEVGRRIGADLLRAELIAFPIAAALLILFFRNVLLGLVPLAVGAVVVVAAISVVGLVAAVMQVSVFATNLVIALGLGLAVDDALLVTARYREELAVVDDRRQAMTRALRTSGRAVVHSAVTVAAALAALLVFPLGFLRSMAVAGIAAALVAAAVTLLVLPAVLLALGRRVTPAAAAAGRLGFWGRAATAVMRHPAMVAALVTVGLVVLLAPARGLQPGFPDDRNLPADARPRQVAEVVRSAFDGRSAAPIEIVLLEGAEPDAIAGYAAAVSSLPGVARVDSAAGTHRDGSLVDAAGAGSAAFEAGSATYVSVIGDVEPSSPAGRALVEAVRAVPAPGETLVGGQAARLADTVDSLTAAVPLAAGIIALVTFVALFMMFGSILVPVKALVLNVLSLTATFGAMVWIFQDGNLSGLLGFTATGTITAAFPVLMFCVAFGLSMDYEVFLLSRIAEEHDLHGDNDRAVIVGLDRTGRTVTFAALLIAVVFAGIGASSIANIKLLGIGLMIAVLMDAFVVRGLLIPAFMKLAGNANWWAPASLRRLRSRFVVDHHAGATEPVAERHPVAG